MIRTDWKCILLIPVFVFSLYSGAFCAQGSSLRNTSQQANIGNATSAGPALKVPETVFDFGLAVDEEEVVHEFKIFNTGTEAVKIQEVIAG